MMDFLADGGGARTAAVEVDGLCGGRQSLDVEHNDTVGSMYDGDDDDDDDDDDR